jgi:hypothetical protein
MLRFEILDTGNTKTIIFLDESEYQERPGNPMLEVQFPSLSAAYRIQIRPKETNSITTKLIGFTKEIEEFPDGLYNLVYSIDPNHLNFICKKYFRLTATKCKIKSLLLHEDISKETIEKLYKLDIYLQAIEEVVDTDKKKALEYFELIQKELKKLECNV